MNYALKKFPDIWFDFRIASYSFLKFNKVEIFNEYLTFYRIKDGSASSKFKTFNKNWWIRYIRPINFLIIYVKKIIKPKYLLLDKLVTNLVNIFI